MENKLAPKRVREVPQKRDLFSKHYINEDGSYTAEISLGIAHYKDENDHYQDVSADLFDEDDFDLIDFPVTKEKKASFKAKREITKGLKEKAADGKLSRETSDFHGLKVPFDVTIPKNFKKGYSIGKGSDRLTFKPEGANNSKAERIGSNALKYTGVWDRTDVLLELKDKGLKETIVLMDPAAPTIFTFEVTGPLKEDFTAGELRLEAAWLIDANGEKRDVQQNIRKQGAKTFLDVVADVYGLAYPIEIDPTVTLQPTTETLGKDAYIYQGSINQNNNLDVLRVGQLAIGQAWRSFIEFDLSTIPLGSSVSSSVFSVYRNDGYSEGSSRTTYVHPVNSAWTETGITWANQPTLEGAASGLVFIADGYYNFTITDIVNRWVAGTTPNNGLAMIGVENVINTWQGMYSSATAQPSEYKPKLAVTYNIPPTAPTVTAPNGGEVWNKSHTVGWNPAIDPDPVEYSSRLPVTTLGSQSFATGAKLSQAFLPSAFSAGVNFIKEIQYPFYSPTGATITVGFYEVDTNDVPTNVLIEQSVVVPFGDDYSYRSLLINMSIDPNKKYAFVYNAVSGGGGNVRVNNTAGSYTSGKTKINSGGTWTDQSKNLDLTMIYQTVNLRYQIQLTTDGTSWSDIVALTTDGATSYTYDFTSKPESTIAKIRVRAYDGSAYGPWDESNSVFTIKHNAPPGKPTSTTPAGTSLSPAIIATLTPTLSWVFNDPDAGNVQASRQVLVYDAAGVLKHDSGISAGAGTTYAVPGGILAWKTKYYWRVRTTDASGLTSIYSDDQWLLTNQGPVGTITAPADTSGDGTIYNDTLQPTITWSYTDPDGDQQKSVQILVKDGAATVFDSGEIVTTGLTYQIPLAAGLVYDKTYTTQIRARDVNDSWGSYSALKYFHLNRSPGLPTGLSPSGNTGNPQVIQDDLQPTLTWTFEDPDATDVQNAFQVVINDSGSGSIVHDSGWVTSAAGSYVVPAGVLISGKKYHWNVKTRDQHLQAGATTANQYFYTNAKPNTPTNPSPAGGSAASPATVLDDLTPNLSWAFADPNGADVQKAFQVKLYNEAGTLLLDSGEIQSAAALYAIPQANKLIYSQKYQWEVRTKDQYDAWSNYTSRGWLTAKVGAPSGVTATADNYGAKIIVNWNDSGAESLQGYNIYRATSWGGIYTKQNGALLTDSVYNDSNVSTGSTYYYQVEAYVTASEISPLSGKASAVAVFSAWYIGSFKFIGPSSFGGKRNRIQSKRAVLGKKKKVIQDRGFSGEELQLEIFLGDDEYATGKQKFDQLMAELEKTEALSVRDPFGQVWKVAPGGVDWNLVPGSGTLTYNVSVPLEEVN